MSSATLWMLQKQDKFCKNKACELPLGDKSSFYLNHEGILKCTLVINNLELSIIVVLLILTNTLLHEFHNCRGHQGCARTLNTLRESFGGKACKNMLSTTLVIVLHALKTYLMFCVTCNYT